MSRNYPFRAPRDAARPMPQSIIDSHTAFASTDHGVFTDGTGDASHVRLVHPRDPKAPRHLPPYTERFIERKPGHIPLTLADLETEPWQLPAPRNALYEDVFRSPARHGDTASTPAAAAHRATLPGAKRDALRTAAEHYTEQAQATRRWFADGKWSNLAIAATLVAAIATLAVVVP